MKIKLKNECLQIKRNRKCKASLHIKEGFYLEGFQEISMETWIHRRKMKKTEKDK